MSHPNPHHDPENVRTDDSKFAPRDKALHIKMIRVSKTKAEAKKAGALRKKNHPSKYDSYLKERRELM